MIRLAFILCFLFVQFCQGQSTFSPRSFVKECKKYKGTPYKFGGVDKTGIDCSGIIYNAFQKLEVPFPRVSYRQAEVFKVIKYKKIKKGDLLYFNTSGSRINHTGVVVKKRGKRKLQFLHASSSSGVRIDNLYTTYWQTKFVKATRPIEKK